MYFGNYCAGAERPVNKFATMSLTLVLLAVTASVPLMLNSQAPTRTDTHLAHWPHDKE